MGKKSQNAAEIAALREQLRTAGLRSTSARITVLQALKLARTPQTHASLADSLTPLGYDKATVYRNLMDLTEAGLVSRTELGDHVWRFELRRGGSPASYHNSEHPHFLCVDCGEVNCLDDVAVTISPSPGAKPSTIGRITEVLLKGHCERCVP
jgi:Fur family ferric uptake transcriptional regulator